MRIAHRHRLDAAPLLGHALRRGPATGSASTCPTRSSSTGASRASSPSSCRSCIDDTHCDEAILAGTPYPGAVETVQRLARRRPLHPRHQPPRRRLPRRDRAAGWSTSACRSTTCTAPTTRSRRCVELEIDVLIDDSPINIHRALERGIVAATLVHPWNEDVCETEEPVDRRRGLAGAGAQARAGAVGRPARRLT